MKTRRSAKRASPSTSCKTNLESTEIKTEVKKQKLENGTGLDEVGGNRNTDDTKPKQMDEDSTDSSSNEFTRQYTVSNFYFKDLDFKGEVASPKADFAAIENNILTGVTRLSDSEDTDFEDIVERPNLNVLQVSLNKQEKESELKDMSDLQKPSKTVNKMKAANKTVNETKPSRMTKRKEANSVKNSHIKSEGRKLLPQAEVDKMDVSQLLALGEASFSLSEKDHTQMKIKAAKIASSEEEHSDWEEVSEIEGKSEKSLIPKEGVQVTLEMPSQYRKHKTKDFDWEAHIKRRLIRVKKEIQELIHKVHLLCWIAHGRFINSILNSDVLMGVALSLIPSQHCYPSKKVDLLYLEQIVKWFSKTVVLQTHEEEIKTSLPLQISLERQFQSKKTSSARDMVLLFICILRALGLKCRLVLSLLPVPLKPDSSELCSISGKKKEQNTKKVSTTEACEKPDENEKSAKQVVLAKKSKTNAKSMQKSGGHKDCQKAQVKTNIKKISTRALKGSSVDDISTENTGKLRRTPRKCKALKHYKNDSANLDEELEMKLIVTPKGKPCETAETPTTEAQDKGKFLKRSVKANISGKTNTFKEVKPQTSSALEEKKGFENSESDFEVEQLSLTSNKTELEDSSSGSEFTPASKKKRAKLRESQGEKLDRRVLSSNSDSSPLLEKKTKKRKGFDVWTEVFVEEEEAWISIDVPHCKIHCAAELFSRATQPVTYVLAFNNDLTVKDVTRRYCPQFPTATRKLRVDEKWWNETLWPFRGSPTAQDREEDEEMNRAMLDRPMPTSVAELKNHPLYVLKRHLLKFQAIYPPDAPPLGFVKGEPVFARECVHTLHSREIWMKEAKVVRLGEKPYKIVKARPKFDRMTGQVVKDLPLETFGSWQVEDYIPPPAVDGKVPRNEYGNVELFKPCMLPKGTVHLQVTGLNRVARKLGIDCAPAVVGFDYHCGSSHPMFDGFVVCEEYKDAIMDAWIQEQDEAERRQKEKLEKRVYGNWRRIIKGLLIRERLKERYSFGEDEQGPSAPRKFSTPLLQPKVSSRDKKPSLKKPARKHVQKKSKIESIDETNDGEEDVDYDSDKDWK